MPALQQNVLLSKLRAALPPGTLFSTGDAIHPAEANVPGLGDLRFYLWTVTHVESDDRPEDEFKIQLILPGQTRQERGELNLQHRATFLLGYSPDYGVFVGWQAYLHPRFAFSKAVQVKENTLDEARRTGWAVAEPRTLRGAGPEVRVTFAPGNLVHYLASTVLADRAGLSGVDREAFFLNRTPNHPVVPVPRTNIEAFTQRLRREQLVRVIMRDSRFGPRVKKEYGFACAVCQTQLEIIEGAHIVPVNVPTSTDDLWNGIALCPNHHKLFDSHAFVVAPDLRIHVDAETLSYLRDVGRAEGIDTVLTAFDRQEMQAPQFFNTDARRRQKMLDALAWRAQIAGLAV